MRLWLLLPSLLVAGCLQPGAPQTAPPVTTNPLPPSLLLDRTPNGTLQVYVHAKQGNVRYDFINLTERNDFQPNLTWVSRTTPHEAAYAVDVDLGAARANLTVDVVQGDARMTWSARVALNETARPATLRVETLEEHGVYATPREFPLPFERLLRPAVE